MKRTRRDAAIIYFLVGVVIALMVLSVVLAAVYFPGWANG